MSSRSIRMTRTLLAFERSSQTAQTKLYNLINKKKKIKISFFPLKKAKEVLTRKSAN